jgi:hypothetical protein
MDTLEQHRVVSVNVKPSSCPLVERSWLGAAKTVLDATLCNPGEAIAAYATEPIGKLSACQPLARAGARAGSSCAASTAPIQYP